jgi:dienelactone hydrolase
VRSMLSMLAIGALAAGAASAQPLKQGRRGEIAITAGDGVQLKGTLYSPGKPGPAVLLLHQCDGDRTAWDPLATALTNAGFYVLTFDFRGYGESGAVNDPQARRALMAQKWPGDVEAAFAILQAEAGVDRTRIAVGGASCGAAQAALLASKRTGVKALVLLSGAAGDDGLRYLSATPGVAVFGAAAEGDAAAAKGIAAALGASKNPHNVLKIIPGAAHGIRMFATSRDLEASIVEWLKAQLVPGPR